MDLFNYLQLHAEDEINETHQDELNSNENIVNSIIEEFYKENMNDCELDINGKYYFNTKKVNDFINEYQPYTLFRNQNELTTYLKKLNINTDRRRYNQKVTSFYTFPHENFQHLELITSGKKAS